MGEQTPVTLTAEQKTDLSALCIRLAQLHDRLKSIGHPDEAAIALAGSRQIELLLHPDHQWMFDAIQRAEQEVR